MRNDLIASFEDAVTKEWLVTNGIGGYASSTVCGANTRRYHGLLAAAFQPPTDRRVLVSKLEETVHPLMGNPAALSANQYPGAVYPSGFQFIRGFESIPFPKTRFEGEGFCLSKCVFMVYGANTTVVEYTNEGEEELRLDVNPLLVYRDYHSLFSESEFFDFHLEPIAERAFKVYPHYDSLPFFLYFSKGTFERNLVWYKNLEYLEEQRRGLDFKEDARSLGSISLSLEKGESAYLVFSAEEPKGEPNGFQWKQEAIARSQALAPVSENTFFNDLSVAGDQFLVRRASSESYSLIAGYHWFTDWGRDTMIAMRGLTIASGKQAVSKSIFQTFLSYLDGGMLPNRFPDSGETPEYNTFDAALWLFVCLYEYAEAFGDWDYIQDTLPKLEEILDAHVRGTRYNIHLTPEGLLFGGEGLNQLTWMDAKVGDFVVTPRQGCPVEINALWYNALKVFDYFTSHFARENSFQPLIGKAEEAFRAYFLNEEGYLNDVVIPGEYADAALRPNQIYAISLPFSLLTAKECENVLAVVDKHLYTDMGLRTLSPGDPDFKPVYEGGPWERDTAYHQGTVWPFLWGEYALAYLKIKGFSLEAKEEVVGRMEGLKNHFYEENGLYGISEVFDGGVPSAGKGCIHQAWSVGMLLKVWYELTKTRIDVASN